MKNYTNLEDIIKSESLTKEQKKQIIQQHFDKYRNDIDSELNKYIARQYIGAALKIGSAAIPAGKAGATLGQELFKRQLGRKISESIGTTTVAGGVYELGEGIMNNDSVSSLIKSTLGGGLSGGAIGYAGGNIQRALKTQQLKNYGNINELNENIRKIFNSDARKFYKDYIKDIRLNKQDSTFEFTRRGIQEQLCWNPKQTQNYSELVKDIKNAKRLPDSPNLKPDQKPDVSHYEIYRGKNGDYYIEVQKNGKRRYYITKDILNETQPTTNLDKSGGFNNTLNNTIGNINPAAIAIPANVLERNDRESNIAETPKSTTPTTNRDALRSSNNIINDAAENINTQLAIPENISYDTVNHKLYGKLEYNKMPVEYSNHIFTPEEIGKMSGEEFAQNEPVIMQQLKDGLIQKQLQAVNYSGYINPITGSGQIFSREDIGAMSNEEYTKNAQAINAQLKSIGIPTNGELESASISGGGTIYVRPYTRSDGTEVRGYYRAK